MISMIHEGEEDMRQIGQSSPLRSQPDDDVRRSFGEMNSSMKKSVRSSLSQVSHSQMIKKPISAEERGLTYGKKVSEDSRGDDKRLKRSLKVDFSYGPSDALKDISQSINNKESIPRQSQVINKSSIKQNKPKSQIFIKEIKQSKEEQQPLPQQKQPREGNSSAIREKKKSVNEEAIMSLILLVILICLIIMVKSNEIKAVFTAVIPNKVFQ